MVLVLTLRDKVRGLSGLGSRGRLAVIVFQRKLSILSPSVSTSRADRAILSLSLTLADGGVVPSPITAVRTSPLCNTSGIMPDPGTGHLPAARGAQLRGII